MTGFLYSLIPYYLAYKTGSDWINVEPGFIVKEGFISRLGFSYSSVGKISILENQDF
jgi:hypothetical protein